MPEFKGTVLADNKGRWRFRINDDPEKPKRLSRARLGQSPKSKEIDLQEYADESLTVMGQEHDDWIMDATIVAHRPVREVSFLRRLWPVFVGASIGAVVAMYWQSLIEHAGLRALAAQAAPARLEKGQPQS